MELLYSQRYQDDIIAGKNFSIPALLFSWFNGDLRSC